MRNQNGSILLEALLATVILSMSITVIMQSLTSSLRAAKYSAQYTKALILLDDQLTEYFQEGFIETGIKETQSFPAPFDDYKYSVSSDSAEDFGEHVNLLEMDINWKSGRRENGIIVETLLFDKEDE